MSGGSLRLTRIDGLGQRILAYLEAAHVSESLGVPFQFLWLEGGGMNDHQVSGQLVDIFPQTEQHVEVTDLIVPDTGVQMLAPQWVYWKGLLPLTPLIDQLAKLSLSSALADYASALPNFRYAIHARQGDVVKEAMQFGMTKWLPVAMYEKLFEEIAKHSDGKDVFVASDCDRVKSLARQHLCECTTEDDFFDADLFPGLNLAQRLWLIVHQLSKAQTIVSPACSAWGLLGRLHHAADAPVEWVTPMDLLGLVALHAEYVQTLSASSLAQTATGLAAQQQPHTSIKRKLAHTFSKTSTRKQGAPKQRARKQRPIEYLLNNNNLVPVNEHPDAPFDALGTPLGMECYQF